MLLNFEIGISRLRLRKRVRPAYGVLVSCRLWTFLHTSCTCRCGRVVYHRYDPPLQCCGILL